MNSVDRHDLQLSYSMCTVFHPRRTSKDAVRIYNTQLTVLRSYILFMLVTAGDLFTHASIQSPRSSTVLCSNKGKNTQKHKGEGWKKCSLFVATWHFGRVGASWRIQHGESEKTKTEKPIRTDSLTEYRQPHIGFVVLLFSLLLPLIVVDTRTRTR